MVYDSDITGYSVLSEVICDYRKGKQTKTEVTNMSQRTENQVAEMVKNRVHENAVTLFGEYPNALVIID